MASDSTDGEIRSTPAESDDEHHGRIRDGGGSTSPLLLQTTRQRSMQKVSINNDMSLHDMLLVMRYKILLVA